MAMLRGEGRGPLMAVTFLDDDDVDGGSLRKPWELCVVGGLIILIQLSRNEMKKATVWRKDEETWKKDMNVYI